MGFVRFAKMIQNFSLTFSERRLQQQGHAHRAGAFSKYRHFLWVASERRDVPLHPFERLDLVQEAVVARDVGVARGEEAERAQAVVEDDHSDVTGGGQRGAIVAVLAALLEIRGVKSFLSSLV